MNIAIYTKSTRTNPDKVNQIREYFLQENYTNIVFLAANGLINNQKIRDIASINSVHLDWFKGTVVFTEVEDYLENKNKIIGEPMLICPKENLQKIDKESLKKCEILILVNGTIRKIKNAELQPLIR